MMAVAVFGSGRLHVLVVVRCSVLVVTGGYTGGVVV